jgi:hypothetical protein
MRLAEARTTLGVIRAREGDLDEAVTQGLKALNGERKSLPSLLMVSRDLTKVLKALPSRDRDPRLPRPARHAHRDSSHELDGAGRREAPARIGPDRPSL